MFFVDKRHCSEVGMIMCFFVDKTHCSEFGIITSFLWVTGSGLSLVLLRGFYGEKALA